MALEIERKFLIDSKQFLEHKSETFHVARVIQGYINVNPSSMTAPTLRVQRIHIEGESIRHKLTVKGAGTLSREEYEYLIPIADFPGLYRLASHSIEKTRYKLNFDGLVWEVDQFHGPHEGLWLAEVELDSEDQLVKLPSWVTDEVTGDPRYLNVSIAVNGVPDTALKTSPYTWTEKNLQESPKARAAYVAALEDMKRKELEDK